MSTSAVRSGQTKPNELLRLIRRGVNVHSAEDLHAKVFVIGGRAIVGSNNASRRSSKEVLIEAAIETDDRSAVTKLRQFVRDLRGEIVGAQDARLMQQYYRPPKFGDRRVAVGAKRRMIPSHPPLWIVPLKRETWSADEHEAEKQGMPTARRKLRKLRSTRHFKVTDFCWEGKASLARIRTRDLILQVTDEGQGRVMCAPPGRVVHVESVLNGGSAIVFVEARRHVNQRSLGWLTEQAGSWARQLNKRDDVWRLKDAARIHKLLNLWPSWAPSR